MEQTNVLDAVRPWWLLPPGQIHPAWWVAVFAAIVGSDYFGGIEFFPLLYAVPVVLAGWYSGRATASALAVAVPLIRLATLVEVPGIAGATWGFAATTIARGVVVFFIGLWFARLSGSGARARPARPSLGGATLHLLLLQEHPQRGWRVGATRGVHHQEIGGEVLPRLLPVLRRHPLRRVPRCRPIESARLIARGRKHGGISGVEALWMTEPALARAVGDIEDDIIWSSFVARDAANAR